MGRAQAAEGGPAGIESQVGPGKLGCDPDAHEHAEQAPRHGQHDADLDRIIVIGRLAVLHRIGRVEVGQNRVEQRASEKHHDDALDTEWVGPSKTGHQYADEPNSDEEKRSGLTLRKGKLVDHARASPRLSAKNFVLSGSLTKPSSSKRSAEFPTISANVL